MEECESSNAGSEAEMGNQHGGGGGDGNKKKKHRSAATNGHHTNGADLSDVDPEYKYVSIVDVDPDSFKQIIGDKMSIEVRSPKIEDILKCNVIIGDTKDNERSVSRVSVNGSFDESFREPDESPFIEQSMEFVPNKIDIISSDVSKVIDGPESFPPAVIVTNENNKNDLLILSVENGSSNLVDSGTRDNSTENGFFTPTGRITPMDIVTNGNHHEDGMYSDDEESNKSMSLEARLARAVRQTLAGREASGMDFGEDFQDEVERVVREKLKRQRSGSSDYWNNDDTDDHCIVDFLDKINNHAEARLSAKRQARAEAREIRMRELERMQRETEDGDKVFDIYSTPEAVNRCVRAGSVVTPRLMHSSNNSYHSSRRSSEDSLEEVNSIRDIRHELKELEEKFKKSMIANAQLDNEKTTLAYQVDLFKDRYEELEEQNLQLMRENKDLCRQLDMSKRHGTKVQEELDITRTQLCELNQLIQEKGLVVVEGDCSSSDEEGDSPHNEKRPKKALVSAEVADVIQQGSGSLDVRLKKFLEERNELLDELRRGKIELEEERARARGRTTNGPTEENEDIQREVNKVIGDYKFKLQKAEQDVNTLQANVARLESQVVRYKTAAETSEKSEDELKLEKRKLQRELRETQARLEELETSNSHLQKRLDKLKNAKSALLKDL